VKLFDFDKFDAAPLQRTPCDYIHVPEFVLPEALASINEDFPRIDEPGNFPLDGLSFGPSFKAFVDAMMGPEIKRRFADKFQFDLEPYPPQMTVRRHMAPYDGNIHNDSRSKKITVLVYFNEEWHQKGGQLRITKNATDMDDYYLEVPPVRGTLFAFRRNDYSFHGFPPAEGERRAIQMYWVEPKRLNRVKATGWKKVVHKTVRKLLGLRSSNL